MTDCCKLIQLTMTLKTPILSPLDLSASTRPFLALLPMPILVLLLRATLILPALSVVAGRMSPAFWTAFLVPVTRGSSTEAIRRVSCVIRIHRLLLPTFVRPNKHLSYVGNCKLTQTARITSRLWAEELPQVKNHYQQLAQQEANAHQIMYPDYRYRARRPIPRHPQVDTMTYWNTLPDLDHSEDDEVETSESN